MEFIPIQNIGLPSNMVFGFGAEIYNQHCFMIGNYRYCIFSSSHYNWHLIKQELEDEVFYEVWSKNLKAKNLKEAKSEALQEMKEDAYNLLNIILRSACKENV